VLLIPEWTQPNPTKEEIRLNGGPPPPQPILPSEFIIQLYNPDHQVTVRLHAGSWTSAPYWEFEMPQESFRRPSKSALDRTQSDPTASDNTPKLNFKWKKDGKLSKDYVCSLSGKSTNPDGSKRKNKEPDITIALFKHFKEITIYEPNLSRVEMEDPKGLEVVLLLGAVVIREVFNSNMRETFNITEAAPSTSPVPSSSKPQPPPRRQHRHHSSTPGPVAPTQNPQTRTQDSTTRPPFTDPRTQWQLDLETARLRQAVEAEEHQRRKADHAETKRVKRMLEEEQRQAHEKQRAIDRETERLKRIYDKGNRQGLQQQPRPSAHPPRQSLQPVPQSQAVTAYPPQRVQRPHSASSPYVASNLRPQQQQSGPYLQRPGGASGSTFFGGPAASSSRFFGGTVQGGRPSCVPKKSSFWGLRRGPEEERKLTKQRSTVF